MDDSSSEEPGGCLGCCFKCMGTCCFGKKGMESMKDKPKSKTKFSSPQPRSNWATNPTVGPNGEITISL